MAESGGNQSNAPTQLSAFRKGTNLSSTVKSKGLGPGPWTPCPKALPLRPARGPAPLEPPAEVFLLALAPSLPSPASVHLRETQNQEKEGAHPSWRPEE